MLFVFICPEFALSDGIICKNGTVFTGYTRQQVSDLCGRPVNVSGKTKSDLGFLFHDGRVLVYVIDGFYRGFVFNGDRLEKILHGRIAD